jgi:hypothetical protein
MRKDIVVNVSAADRARLEAIVADRNTPQKIPAGSSQPSSVGTKC